MSQYVTAEEFNRLSLMPREDIESLFATDQNWLVEQIASVSRLIDGRLSKRYASPFAQPYPEILKNWVVRIVTPRVYLRRGVSPSDEQFTVIKEDGDAAWLEVKEAADSKDGLFELPAKETDSTNGVTRGGPLGYAEASPYTWTDVQAESIYG